MKGAFYKIQILLIGITLVTACSKQSQDLAVNNNTKQVSSSVSIDPKLIAPGPMPYDSAELDSLRRKGFY